MITNPHHERSSNRYHFANLPVRKGKRPITIRGPLHLQCSDNRESKLLRDLVQEVAGWPGVEADSLPAGGGGPVSLQIDESLANNEGSSFISGYEFARVYLSAPTIYLALPLSDGFSAVVRGWAEPHLSGSFGLMPAGVMVVYTPRDEEELDACRSLFLTSYRGALAARSSESGSSYFFRPEINRYRRLEEVVAAA